MAIKVNIGDRYSRLEVIGELESVVNASGESMRVFRCLCDCGKEVSVRLKYLRNGGAKSCGCYREDMRRVNKKTHGMSHTTEYEIWSDMKKRCSNNRHAHYDRYGGRGIAVCDRWLKFENFYADMGIRPEGMTIERVDNDKGYSPDNCKWATYSEQARNRRNSLMLDVNGASINLTTAADSVGIHARTLLSRLRRGMSTEDALTKPVRVSKGLYRQILWPS